MTGVTIFTYYPDFGQAIYKLIFNQELKPRPYSRLVLSIHILFCRNGKCNANEPFQPDHFVLLVINTRGKSKLKPSTGGLPINKKAKTFFPIKEQQKISFPGCLNHLPVKSSQMILSCLTKKVISTNISS